METVTDFYIVLECLHESYGLERDAMLSGRDVRKTMIYPFIKMIEAHCVGISEKEIHMKLWEAYKTNSTKDSFLRRARIIMEPYYLEETAKSPI